MKTCTRCNVEKPLDEFGRHPSTRDRKVPLCRPCMSATRLAYYHADPMKWQRHSAASAYLRFKDDPEFWRLVAAKSERRKFA